MAQFSFDIVSDFDKGEMINVYDQTGREITARYDFKGSSASIEWLPEKTGFKLTGDTQFHLDAIIDVIRKKAASRNVNQKTFDVTKEPETTNLRMYWTIPFKKGLDQEKAKKISALIRDSGLKVKPQIQGDEVRVTGAKKDDLQAVMQLLKSTDFDFPLEFTNFR